jgi:ABC-2 type transport system permease protein
VIQLVAAREISQRLRAKSFYIGTGLLIAIILAVGLITRFAGGDDAPSDIAVAVVADPAELTVSADAIEATVRDTASVVDRGATVEFFADLDAAQTALKEGDVDVVLHPAQREALFQDDIDDEVLAVVQQAWAQVEVRDRLGDAGLDPERDHRRTGGGAADRCGARW